MNRWQNWIEKLTREHEFPQEFEEALRAVARRCYGTTSVGWYSADDLVSDFALFVLSRRAAAIQSEKGVERRMMIILMQRIDPVAKQTWDVLSTAMRTLQREQKVRRLHEPTDRPNHNAAIWTSAAPRNDSRKFDALRFDATTSTDSIRTLFRTPWQSEHGKRRERILSPADAETSLLHLLAIADGPVPFGVLFDEARKHIFAHRREDAEDQVEIKASDLLNPSEEFLAAHESSRIATTVWSSVKADDRLRTALCEYLLPKWRSSPTDTPITQKDANVADEWVRTVKMLIANEFRPELFEAGSREGQITRRIAQDILDRLEIKCAEKSGNRSSS